MCDEGLARTGRLGASGWGLPPDDPALKERTKGEVEKALAAGAFGSPYIVVDGEPFWGSDRFDQIDRWLQTGGW